MTGNNLWQVLASRLLQGLLVVFLVVTAVFFVSRVTRDPIAYLADIQSTEAEIDALRERFGLNDPLYVQYGNFLWNTVQLDMGRSLLNGRPALNEVTSRVLKTLQLGAGSLLFALVLGLVTGVIASLRRDRPTDWLARLLAVICQAVPDFWLGLILVFLFAVELGWLPTGGSGSLKHMLMRLSHLTAVATLVALLGAMFVAMGSASAATLLEACKAGGEGPTLMGISDTCTFGTTSQPEDDLADDATKPAVGDYVISSNDDVATFTSTTETATILAVGVGSATITYVDRTAAVDDNPGTPGNEARAATSVTHTFAVEVKKLAVTKIQFGSLVDTNDTPTDNRGDDTFVEDTDNVFAAGTDVIVLVTASYAQDNSLTFTVTAPSTGLSLGVRATAAPFAIESTTQRQSSEATGDEDRDANMVTVKSPIEAFTLVTDGAPDGEYTITAFVTDGDTTPATVSAKATAKLRIGEAGNSVGTASLSLGLEDGFLTPRDGSDDKVESGSDNAAGDVNLSLAVENGIGNPVNDSDVAEIRVVAPFGKVQYLSGTSFVDAGANNVILGSALTNGALLLKISSENDAERTIPVKALVIGARTGFAETEEVLLTFTGPQDAVEIADATETLRSVNIKNADDELVDDEIDLAVSATDKAGNVVAPDSLGWSITITNEDGDAIKASDIGRTHPTWDAVQKRFEITVSNESGNTAASALETGDYTLTAKKGDIEASASFTVVGTADSVDIVASDPDEYGQIEVTVTVLDANEKPVADGTPVKIAEADLRGDRDQVLYLTDSDGKTTNGVAMATFITIGPGRATIIGTADSKTDVVRVTSTYDAEPVVEPEPETVGTHCIRNQGGFATWTCGVEAMASEVFALVQPEGATAIHL